MKLFERREDSALFKLAFDQGEKFGRLAEQLDQMKTTVAELKAAQPAGQGLPELDPAVVAAVKDSARGIPELYRHLESQARDLIDKGIPIDTVVEQIRRGATTRSRKAS